MNEITRNEVSKLTGKSVMKDPPLGLSIVVTIFAFALCAIPVFLLFKVLTDNFFAIAATVLACYLLIRKIRESVFKLIGQKSRRLQVKFVEGKIKKLEIALSRIDPEPIARQKIHYQVFSQFDDAWKNVALSHFKRGETILNTESIILAVGIKLTREFSQKVAEYNTKNENIKQRIRDWENFLSKLKE